MDEKKHSPGNVKIYIFVLKTNQTQEIFRMIYLFIIKYIFAFCERFSLFLGDIAELFVASVYLIDRYPHNVQKSVKCQLCQIVTKFV